MIRKALEATDTMEIWGDGEQTRSFLYIDDCIDAVRSLMEFGQDPPVMNIGSEEMVSINQLADIAINLTDKEITKQYVDGPQGVRGRNSDNTLIETWLNWKPRYDLESGMALTFKWIENEYQKTRQTQEAQKGPRHFLQV